MLKKKNFGFIEKCKRFFWTFRLDRGAVLRAVVLRTFYSSHAIFTVYVLKEFVTFLEGGNVQQFRFWLWMYVGSAVLFHVLKFFFLHWGWSEMFFKNLKFNQSDVLRKFLHLDNNAVEKVGTGKVVSNLTTGLEAWSDWIRHALDLVLELLFALCFTAWIIGQMGITYLFFFLLAFIVIFLFINFINEKEMFYRRPRINLFHERTRQFVKIIMSKFEILQNNAVGQEINRVNTNVEEQSALNHQQNYLRYFNAGMPQLFVQGLRVIVLFVVGKGVLDGVFTLGEFVVLMAVIGYTETILFKFRRAYKDFYKDYPKIEKLWEFLDTTSQMRDIAKGKKFLFKKGNIELRNVSFSYGDDAILDKFSLHIQGAKKTALVGISGGGKSTLVKLIAGYLSPQKGNIYVDGQKFSDLAMKSYFAHVGYLTQEPNVFDGTIRENLEYGYAEGRATSTSLQEVLTLAKCEFVLDLKDGLDTEIGERGVRLSGGQKQRLAIAKIMLKSPEIILLDEPTSALDSVSEQKVSEALHNLFKGRTVIVIAHRLQTVKEADDIIVLAEGGILERGTHQELEKLGGVYKQMLELQTSF